MSEPRGSALLLGERDDCLAADAILARESWLLVLDMGRTDHC